MWLYAERYSEECHSENEEERIQVVWARWKNEWWKNSKKIWRKGRKREKRGRGIPLLNLKHSIDDTGWLSRTSRTGSYRTPFRAINEEIDDSGWGERGLQRP